MFSHDWLLSVRGLGLGGKCARVVVQCNMRFAMQCCMYYMHGVGIYLWMPKVCLHACCEVVVLHRIPCASAFLAQLMPRCRVPFRSHYIPRVRVL